MDANDAGILPKYDHDRIYGNRSSCVLRRVILPDRYGATCRIIRCVDDARIAKQLISYEKSKPECRS
jgi:hypothetical protein